MSHVTRGVTDVVIKDGAVLKEAIVTLAMTLEDGKVEYDAVPTDWVGRTVESTWGFQRCAMLLRWRTFTHGLGIDVVEGKLAFTVDWYGHEAEVKDVQRRVKQFYAAAYARKVFLSRGMKVQSHVGQNGQLVISGDM